MVIIAVLFTVAYFILSYRVKEVVAHFVEEQSKGEYALTTKKLRLSLWRGRIELENAQIIRVGPSVNDRFIVQLPAIYFELKSWGDLLFKKKLSVDSVLITHPSFEIFEEGSNNGRQRKIIIQTIPIFETLNEVVDVLNIRSFRLVDGSFVYHPDNGDLPFESHHINISIRNFGRDENNSKRFLSSDDVEVIVRDQDWKLGVGNREIKFKELRFSGKKQFFELDSIEFSSRATDNQSALKLNIDKLTFNSKRLSAFYETNELLIDTLTCFRPVLQLQLDKDTSSVDTNSVINESLKSLFTNIQIKFFDIHEGQFTIEGKSNGKSLHYSTEKTNLKIEDIAIQPNGFPFLTTGNIDLKLNEIRFYTPDSLYQLAVDEFDLYNGNLRFKNAFFSPTSRNHQRGSFMIRIPVLTLKNLDLKKLLQKRLVAGVAEMDGPVVTIQLQSGIKKNKDGPGNWSGFYDALQELSELMQVKTLNIKNGTVNYRSLSDSSITAKLSGFNISVLLNDFLKSKSLTDIKHSIPYLVAGEVIYHSQTLSGVVNQLRLIGSMQQSMTNKIEIELANGMKFKGKEIYLKDLDWDELINKNAIIADSVNIDDLIAGNDYEIRGNDNSVKVTELPLISIRKLGINEFKLQYTFSTDDNAEAKAKGKDIMFTDLSTMNDTFLWSNAAGVFTNFEYTSPGVSASSDKINFEVPGETSLIRIKADVKNSNATIHAVIPEIKLESTITSTDFSRADLSAIIINQPLLEVTQILNQDSGTKPFTVPFDFTIGSTNINGAQIRYKLNNGMDSFQISSTVSGSLDSLMSGIREFESFHFSKLNLALSEITIHNEKLNVEIPSMEFIASDAGIYNEEGVGRLQSFISANWNHAGLDLSFKKNSKVKVNNFSGVLAESKLELNPNEKFQWKEWLNRAQVLSARLQFSDSARNVSLNNIQWNPNSQELQIDSFLMQPKISQREYFRKTPWQSEYIRLHGSSLIVSGIDFDKWQNDSLFQASKISFNGIAVDAWRDRRIPFKHGIEKSMPTRLINSISYHFNIDSITVKNGDVQYHEFSNITGREGIVPLKNISVTVLNVKNYHAGNADTLTIRGKAKLLNSSIKKFRYAEAYNDSLGSFRLSAQVSPAPLNEFSRISNPLAAVDINEGVLDTLAVRISGNKYAAFGEIVFYYHDLKIKLLDHEDTTRKRISLSFANFVTNRFVIKTNNRKQSVIFYIRDREKFVFNYWVKALMSGMLASAGVKRSKAYKKQYQKLKGEYTLPELTF